MLKMLWKSLVVVKWWFQWSEFPPFRIGAVELKTFLQISYIFLKLAVEKLRKNVKLWNMSSGLTVAARLMINEILEYFFRFNDDFISLEYFSTCLLPSYLQFINFLTRSQLITGENSHNFSVKLRHSSPVDVRAAVL